jgi:uncharacterized protein YbjT (DUF2867 family)
MKVLVTGATGFIGTAVCAALTSAGVEVRRLARTTARNSRAAGAVESIAGSVLEPSSLRGVCAGCDAVVHLVGIISECREQTFEAVHVEGTRAILRAALDAGVSRFVQMSALGTRPGAVARYHRSKWEAEELVRGSGLDWTVFRPSLVYGAGGGFTSLMEKMSRWSPVMPVIGSGKGLLQPVAVEDVARCFAAAAISRASTGKTFDLCGLERLTFEEVLKTILAAKRRRRLLLHLPVPVARVQARLLEAVYPAVFGVAPPLNRDQILMLAEDNTGDPAPAMAAFGFRPLNFRERIGECF